MNFFFTYEVNCIAVFEIVVEKTILAYEKMKLFNVTKSGEFASQF